MSLTIEQNQHCLIVTLNRPNKRNALNSEMIEHLQKVLQEYKNNTKVRSMILRGEGDHFCAGADIKEMEELHHKNYQENLREANHLANLFWQLYTFPKPVITLAQGSTLGGGIGLLAASDIVLAAPHAVFAFSEVKLGIIPAIISPYVFRAVGKRMLHRYFLTGEKFDVKIAHHLGLVHEIVEQDLLTEALKIANLISGNAPNAISRAKELIIKSDAELFDQNYALSLAEDLATMRQLPEAKEGMQAFIEKRTPNWSILE